MEDRQPRRRYNSASRRARVAESRLRILQAAHELFVARGFAGTTIADIASAADVSPPTVFALHDSKTNLLKTCIDVALAGDDADVAVGDRPLAMWVAETDDARVLLGRYAVMMGEIARRAAPIYSVLVRAADAEPELAALLKDLEQQRLRAATRLAEAVRDRAGLPPRRSLNDARDTIWICNVPELYIMLTRSRRWSTRRYVEWARDALIKLVIEPPVPGEAPTPLH
jgi:AcrR family transcriptional regulator